MHADHVEDLSINKEMNKIGQALEQGSRYEGKKCYYGFEDGMKQMLKEAFRKQNFTEEVAALA